MVTAFGEAGLPTPDLHHVRRSVGLSLPQAIVRLAPDASAEVQANAVEAYKTAFRGARLDGSLHEPLFDGIPALLARLRVAGWTLGVATGKSDRGLRSCLQTHGVFDLFLTLQTADRHPSKPHPAMLEAAMAEALAGPGETVMIGDTVFDIDMARSAGCRAIGVAWGYHAPEELIAAGAESVAETPEELGDLLDV
jgi:phosphoglycolate phosphatase